MYSAAARTPASDSNGQRAELPAVRGLVGRRVELVRVELLEDLRARAEHGDVRAEPLVGAAADDVGAELGEVEPPVRRGVDGVDVHARADAAPRRRRSPRRSGTEPIALDAAVTATHLVRSDSAASTALAGSSSVDSSGSAKRTVTPARSAAITHGRTLESWSSRVQTISSPGDSERTTVAAKRIVSAVKLGPKLTPDGSPPSSVATAARVDATSSSVSRACLNCPPWLACEPDRIQSAIASIALSTTWLPAGPVQPRPALAQRGEAIAVHRSETSWARSASCS